jgi:hypothetical protein
MGVTLFIDSFLSNDFSQLTPLSGKIQPEDLQMRKGEWGMKKRKGKWRERNSEVRPALRGVQVSPEPYIVQGVFPI